MSGLFLTFLNVNDFLDPASVFIFALTGGLVASRAQLDIFGFCFLACLAGVGGGTIRDLVLQVGPVFWVKAPINIFISISAAVVVYFTAHLFESRYRILLWLDAFALAIAVSAGVSIAHDQGHSWIIVTLMGISTGTCGGLLRDVVANEMPLVLKNGEMYASAAAIGATTFTLILFAGGHEPLALWGASLTTFCLRAGSLALGWRIPVYKPRAIRTNHYDTTKK